MSNVIGDPARVNQDQSEAPAQKDRRRRRQYCGYGILIMELGPRVSSWEPDRLEDCPPEIGNTLRFLRRSGPIGELLREVRQINRTARKHGMKQWAVIAQGVLDARGRFELGRIATPFEYRRVAIRIETGWRPQHLLDAPDFEWSEHEADEDMTSYSSLESALRRTLRDNSFSIELDVDDDDEPPEYWTVLVAIELDAQLHDVLFDSRGTASFHRVIRFHVVDQTWPLPRGVNLALDSKNDDEPRGWSVLLLERPETFQPTSPVDRMTFRWHRLRAIANQGVDRETAIGHAAGLNRAELEAMETGEGSGLWAIVRGPSFDLQTAEQVIERRSTQGA